MTKIRKSSIEMGKEEFRKIGYQLIDDISDFINSIDQKPVTPNESPSQLQNILGDLSLPENGKPATELISKTTDLLFNHSLLNGHPKFCLLYTSPSPRDGLLSRMP